jgi:uncharacterized protein YjiS (DUF1127 family)
MACESFIYVSIRPMFTGPPKGAAEMVTLRSILDSLREAALCCIGSPDSRTRQLAALRNLDAHLLKDIGVTREEAHRATTARTVAGAPSGAQSHAGESPLHPRSTATPNR